MTMVQQNNGRINHLSPNEKASSNGAADIADFLRTLYGDNAPGYLSLFTLPGSKTEWVPADRIEDAAKIASDKARHLNVYLNIGLRPDNLGSGKRGESSSVFAIPGFWADIDIMGPAHKSQTLPPTEADALALIAEMGVKPTLLVHSGHGLQAWWLFREPWVFESDEERKRAKDLALRFQSTLQIKAAAHGWTVDSVADLARVLRIPGTFNRKTGLPPVPVRLLEADDSARYDPSDLEPFLIDSPAPTTPNPTASSLPRFLRKTLNGSNPATVPVGSRALRFFSFGAPDGRQRPEAVAAARNCCSAGLPVEEAARLIWQGFQASKQDDHNPWTEEDAEAIAEDIYTKPPSKTLEPLAPMGNLYVGGRLVSGPSLSASRPKRPLTETGNAERLVDTFGDELRYCYEWNKWLVWDGARWVIDSGAAIDQLAKAVSRSIYSEAGREEDDEKRKSVASWARASESKRARSNMVALAQSEPGVSINPDKLDADPWLLNVENGAIDLRTGQLREHRRENLITKLVPVEYDPQAACPIFDRFLSEVQPEEANRLYLQRWAGYSATGSTREERLSIWYGSGANGKTTLARAIQDRLGAYAKQIDPDVLMQSKYGQHPTGRASLFGVRAVFASETGDGQALAEKLVKSISSRDIMEARFIGENYFTWVPTHSLAILTNHKPEIQGTDNGIWRRIDLLPWTVTISDDRKDPDLLDKLATEAAGILAWIVEGAADWYANGLTRPAAIVEATAAYREQADIIGPFLSDCCVIDRKASVSVRDIYTQYQTWALTNGEEPTDKKDFGKRLSERGFGQKKGAKGVRFWGGIGLNIKPPLPEDGDENEENKTGGTGGTVSPNLPKSFFSWRKFR